MMVVAGVYIVAFWTAELAGTTAGPLSTAIGVVERRSSQVTNLIGSDPLLRAAAFGAIVIPAVVGAVRGHGRARAVSQPPAHQREH